MVSCILPNASFFIFRKTFPPFLIPTAIVGAAELRGGEPCLATEIAAEGGLLVEAQHVGDGLHREVVSHVEQHLGFNYYLLMYPVGGCVARLLLDDGAEMLGRQAGLSSIETHVAMLAKVLFKAVVKPGTDLVVGVGFVQFALAVSA